MPLGLSDHATGGRYILNGGGSAPPVIEFRYCPMSPFHWKTEAERCPVCKAAIKTKRYVEDGE